ncbi:MAG: translocation/assembly module TamB domain-containing protein, partial [Bacteroidota bacterium]|nr:translocation/assembly module TamB domain-containing protein [Bacteroidota bacterium]
DDAEYLLLQSQYADARIDGRFDFPRFFDYFSLQVDSLSAALAQFSFASDSGTAAEEHTAVPSATEAVGQSAAAGDTAAFMDAFYSITLKNPERIARYFNASTFLVRGTYRGNIHGGNDGFSVDGQLQLSDFYLVDSTQTLLAAGVRCNYDIRNLQLEDPLKNVTAELRFTAADMHLNGLRLSRTAVDFDYAAGRPTLRVRSMVDTLLQLDLQAVAQFRDYGFDVQFPILRLLYLEEDWRNERPVRFRIDSSGIALEHFTLRQGAMRLALTGERSFGGDNEFTLYGDSLDVSMVEYFTTGRPEARENRSFGGLAFVEATLGGSDAEPLMAAEVYIDSLGYRGMHFGELVLEARYFDRQLELYSELDYQKSDETQEKVFFLSGTVPAHISFSEEEPVDAREETEASLRLQMREFPLALIEDFLGFFSPLKGSAYGDVTVSGTAEKPSFEGYITISNAKGRFVYNNMEYLLNLRIEAIEQNIRIVKATIENVSSDWPEGRMSASGSISTEAFAIDEFDLAVEGKLKVLQPASRSSLRSLYGDLYIGTGANELTYTGRLDRSRLTGNLVVEQGNLTFPLQENGGGVNEYSGIKYVVVDDTTTQVVSSLSTGRFGRMAERGDGDGGVPEKPERSVLEGLSYDLRLSTDGRLVVRIPFSVLQEELNAALEFDDLKVSSFGGDGMTFVGEVQLGPESSFLFLGKRLSADGSLYFTRDPMNPDLDLQAVYSDYYTNPEMEVNRKVYVVLNITGTKNKPKLDWDLRWDAVDGEPVAAAGDVQSDASSFLLFGVFASDISANEGQSSSLAAKSPELVNQLGSSLASTAVTQLFNRLGLEDVIKRIDFSGIGTENSRVKLTSEIGQSIITYDGKINNIRSSNLTVEFPLSRIVGVPWLNQVIQVSRITTHTGIDNPSQPTEYSVWELKILQRFSF